MGVIKLPFATNCMPVIDRKKQATIAATALLSRLPRLRPMVGLGCILACLFFIDPATGQEEAAGYVSPHEPANEYFEAIDRIEAEYGPYATELSDLYLGLGQTLINKGDFEQARDAFHRGVMVVRVNSGPNSPEQTNHLYLLANIETLLGELNVADEILHNIYFINSNYYGQDNPELLPALERIYNWYMVTRPPGSTNLDFDHYEKIIKLTDEAAHISELTKGKEHPDTAVAYRRLGDAQFHMVRHLTGSGMMMTPEIYVAATSGALAPLGFGSETVVKHYNAGRKAFTNYFESMLANKSTTPLQYAEALADLGDWFMVFERPRKSRSLYEQGYQILAENAENTELAERFMSLPQPMHFISNHQHGFFEGAPKEAQETSIDISMTVTSLGQVRNVEVLNAPEGMAEDDLREIKRQMMLTPFRPAMKEGEVVTTKSFIWQFGVTPDWKAS